MSSENLTDAFVQISLDDNFIATTHCIDDDLEPKWNETYSLDVCHYTEKVCFHVNDEECVGHEKLGSVSFKALDLQDGVKREDVEGYPIKSKHRRHKNGRLFLSIQYIHYSEIQELPYEIDAYFPAQKHCGVTLYQDAHVPAELSSCSRDVDTDDYDEDESEAMHTLSHSSCWKDVHSALIQAENLICITGWSVLTGLKLLRGEDQAADLRTLGQILVDKANQGTKVYVMVWDERATGKSNLPGGLPVMNTHDEETFNFFKNTGKN